MGGRGQHFDPSDRCTQGPQRPVTDIILGSQKRMALWPIVCLDLLKAPWAQIAQQV